MADYLILNCSNFGFFQANSTPDRKECKEMAVAERQIDAIRKEMADKKIPKSSGAYSARKVKVSIAPRFPGKVSA